MTLATLNGTNIKVYGVAYTRMSFHSNGTKTKVYGVAYTWMSFHRDLIEMIIAFVVHFRSNCDLRMPHDGS